MQKRYKVKYYTVSRLMDELKLARLEGHELKFFERMEHLDLLIIDDFGMKKLEGSRTTLSRLLMIIAVR